MRAEAVRVVVAFVACGALACGNGANHGGAGGSGTDGGSDGPHTDTGLCNNSVPIAGAPLVTEIATRETPPDGPAGGTIVGGTYYLVSETFYEVPDCTYIPGDPGRRAVLIIADSTGSGRMEIAALNGSEESHWTIGYSISGTSVSTTPFCDTSGRELPPPTDAGIKVSGFTATPDQLAFFNVSYCGMGIDVLTKQ